MRCKVGDLVRYVGFAHPPLKNCRGWIGRVISYDPANGNPAWRVDPPMAGNFRTKDGLIADGNWVYDEALRPIDNPGDDAIDEFLALTGKPDYKQKIAEKIKERV